MAERRMFAKTIVLSDAFLDMPLSARCLYFTLGMVADDDGFVNAPRAIMRQCGASDDDMKLLIAKKFVLIFDTGVIVIKGWRINNYLRNDRYTETKYKEEKATLAIDVNGSYRLKEPEHEQPVEIEQPKLTSTEMREAAYKRSSLPYSFEYKIKYEFEGKPCPVCGFPMRNIENGIHRPTIQHNIPISKGGEHELDNISIICHSCNVSIRANETGKLNNDEVKVAWARISGIPGIPGIPNNVDTQVRLGKDRLGQYSIGKDRSGGVGENDPTGTPPTLPNGEPLPEWMQTGNDNIDSAIAAAVAMRERRNSEKTNT